MHGSVNVPGVGPMSGASAKSPGRFGLVPAPAAGDQDKCLRGDGVWYTTSRFYNDKMRGWRVCRVGDKYMIAHCSFIQSKVAVDSNAPTSIGHTGVLYLPAPFPMGYLVPIATCDRGGQYISSVNSVYGDAAVGFSYRIFDPNNPATTISSSVRFAIFGDIKSPPAAPTKPYDATAAEEIVAIAQSYVDAQISGRKFMYGENFFYGSASYPINDDTGAAKMECDTYVGMVLRGISYANSPFADDTPNLFVTYDDMMTNCDHSTSAWCTSARELITGEAPQNVLKHDIKYADELAWLAWSESGRVFSGYASVRPGDVAIWKRPDKSDYFDNIGHVAIVGNDGYIYECTGRDESNGKYVHKKLLSEKAEQPSYFARLY